MRRFISFITEGVGDMHIAAAAGRLIGTKEHGKLLDRLFAQKAHKHYVFVMGPRTEEETTDKDPLTVDEKIAHLKKLYPDRQDSFVPGTDAHTKTPNQAMAWMYHRHKGDANNLHLTMVAGSGEKGVKTKSGAGGSADNYRELMQKLNGTRFPVRKTETGDTVGGDFRMNYASTNVVENPRGTTSGSVIRDFARNNDHTNAEHVSAFKELMHPNMSPEDAAAMMQLIKARSARAKGINKK